MCICNVSGKHALHISAVTIKYQTVNQGEMSTPTKYSNLHNMLFLVITLQSGTNAPPSNKTQTCFCLCLVCMHVHGHMESVLVYMYIQQVYKFTCVEFLTAPWPLQKTFPRYTDSDCDHQLIRTAQLSYCTCTWQHDIVLLWWPRWRQSTHSSTTKEFHKHSFLPHCKKDVCNFNHCLVIWVATYGYGFMYNLYNIATTVLI